VLAAVLAASHSGVRVIHPGKAALRLANLFVEMGISYSKRSYPQPMKHLTFPV
jgi:hypothetical protein